MTTTNKEVIYFNDVFFVLYLFIVRNICICILAKYCINFHKKCIYFYVCSTYTHLYCVRSNSNFFCNYI